MKTLSIVSIGALSLALALAAGCSTSGRGVCVKQSECCSVASKCDNVNAQGPGYQDRCDINYQAELDKLGTYGNKMCDDIANKMDALKSCLAGITCVDVASDGHVAKCDLQATDLCNAQKISGDACGHDYKGQSCDGSKARLFSGL